MPVIVLPAGGPGRPPGSPQEPAWPRLAAVMAGTKYDAARASIYVGTTKWAAGAALFLCANATT